MNRRIARGFTLVEMLVVVAILGILMGILVPALGTAMRRARLAHCLNNMGQHAKALNMYATENHGRTLRPAASGHWMAVLDSHMGRIGPRGEARLCPEASRPGTAATATQPNQVWKSGDWIGSIAVNSYIAPSSTPVPAGYYSTLSQTDSSTPAFLDGMSFETGAVGAGTLPWPRVFERHRGVINVSFCDGHVEAIDEDGLRLKVWRRQ